MRANVGACRTHEGGSGTNKSAQGLARKDRKTVAHPVPPGRGSNPESSDLNSTIAKSSGYIDDTLCFKPSQPQRVIIIRAKQKVLLAQFKF